MDEPSQPKPKKRFYHQEYSIGNKDIVSNKCSQVGGHTFERLRCAISGKKHLGKCFTRTDGCFVCGNKGHKMRDFPNLKEKGKNFNQYPQHGLDPNAPK